jgi:sigma-B regulation protein RsbU (phosphoserine phosphatase)
MSQLSTSTKASVLVVDDVAENRDLLVRRLKRLGIDDIEQAANGIEALAAIDRKTFQLVLLDIMMPEMDGFGVLERLKADGRINDLPVVVISALSEIEPVVRCVELGAEDFIFKPFNPTLLRARVTSTLEKKALRDRTREELRRKQAELNEARTLQLALAPPAFRGVMNGRPVSIDVLLEPAKEVGGDLVDHFRVGEDLLVLALGDVSDKGAGAALMMARTHSLIRSLSVRPDARTLFEAPEQAVGLINAALAEGNSSCMFVTFFLATVDLSRNRMAYVRAGHVPPFVRRAGGAVERLTALGGLPLGMMEGAAYKAGSTSLDPGDRILILTDGYTEAADPSGALFGEAPIEALMAGSKDDDDAMLKTLTRQVRAFEAGQPASDDMAAILLWLEPGPGTGPGNGPENRP